MTKWIIFPAGVEVYEVEASSPGAAVRKANASPPRKVRLDNPTLMTVNERREVRPPDVRPPSKGGWR